jgi:mono/diheme cytochrome c family protein
VTEVAGDELEVMMECRGGNLEIGVGRDTTLILEVGQPRAPASEPMAPSLQSRRAMRQLIPLLGLALVAVPACTLAQGPTEAPAVQGRRLYTEHGCYGCHTTGAAGTPIAPDLSRVGLRYSESDLLRLLRDPAVHKPGAHMPKLALTEAERRALAAYLATLR